MRTIAPSLPSQSPSSRQSASASQLSPKCSGSRRPSANAASSVALGVRPREVDRQVAQPGGRRGLLDDLRLAVVLDHAGILEIAEIGKLHSRILLNDA